MNDEDSTKPRGAPDRSHDMQPIQPPAGGYRGEPDGEYPGCYRHPDRPTGVRCVRCDRPICGECQRPGSVGFQCPDDVRAGNSSVRRPRSIIGAPVSQARPVVSYCLIGLNVLAYLAMGLSTGGTLSRDQGSQLFADWVLLPYSVGHHHEYYRLLTAAFTHIGPLHLAMNMFALYVMGPGLERLLGWWRFLAVYLLAAIGGSVAILFFDSRGGAGASGAIFGLFGAALLLSRVMQFDARPLVLTVGLNFLITFSVPGISKFGHLGGFLLGGLAMFALLGWTLVGSAPEKRTVARQAAWLGALAILLVCAAVWRAITIAGQPAIYG